MSPTLHEGSGGRYELALLMTPRTVSPWGIVLGSRVLAIGRPLHVLVLAPSILLCSKCSMASRQKNQLQYHPTLVVIKISKFF